MYDPLEPGKDPSQNYLEHPHQPLDQIFNPRSIAVIGATEKEGSVGRTLMANIIAQDFGGQVYPVNPKRDKILGVKCFPNVGALPGDVDLAIIITPAKTVPGLITECVNKRHQSGHHYIGGIQRTWPSRNRP